MNQLHGLLIQIKNSWHTPKPAMHRGIATPFRLCCTFNASLKYSQTAPVRNMPQEAKEFYEFSNGATLFKDDEYGQWGLRIYTLNETIDATEKFLHERNQDSREGDIVIGEFIGDSDLLLLRCNPNSKDFGYVVVVSAINPRNDWDVAATDFVSFLQELYSHQGDKYWELVQ